MSFGPMAAERLRITDDAALGGRLKLLQPERGHRFGHDAILLAASVAARPGESIVELGAGVGAAALALLARVPGANAVLVEIVEHGPGDGADGQQRAGFHRFQPQLAVRAEPADGLYA